MSSSAMNQVASTASTDIMSPLDVFFRVAEGKYDIKNLDSPLDLSLIDTCNSDGQTPLMVACLNGQEDGVEFFLEKGANPNSQCNKGNTPLHYACKAGIGSLAQLTCQKAILRSLLENRAIVMHNQDGLTPQSTAACSGAKELVDFILERDDIEESAKEKTKTLELLGVSNVFNEYLTEAYDIFCQALSFKEESKSRAASPMQERMRSDLEACFAVSCGAECKTLDRLQSIRSDNDALKMHAFLVWDRLLPQTLKKVLFYPKLLRYAKECMFGGKSPEKGFHLLTYLLKLEEKSYLEIESVLATIADAVDWKGELGRNILEYTCDLLHSYVAVVMQLESAVLIPWSGNFKAHCAEILFNLAFYYFKPEIVNRILSSVEQMLTHIQCVIIRRASDSLVSSATSVTLGIMAFLAEAFVDNMYSGISSGCLNRVKFVICRIARHEDMKYVDDEGNTVLHVLISISSVARDLDYIESLARFFVRQGCPVAAVNKAGETAEDILLEITEGDVTNLEDLFTIIRPPATPLRLEEIGARAVLKWNIPYRSLLPCRLWEMVEGGDGHVKDADLMPSESEKDESNEEC